MFGLSKNMVVSVVAGIVSIISIAVLVWRASSGLAPLPPQVEPREKAAVVVPDAAPAAGAPDPVARPSFDVVRVEPRGDTVVAGRAAPGSVVTLMVSGKPAGTATADANGQFVIIPEALKPGTHDLTLSQQGQAGAVSSAQNVVVALPAHVPAPGAGASEEVVVALAEPGKPTQVLSALGPKANAAMALAIRTAEAEQDGGFFATGSAAPGAKLRIYLNDSHVAEIIADALGQWSLRVSRGMSAGNYAVRADQIDPASGAVTGRVEVPFTFAAQTVAALQPPQAQAATGAGAGAAPAPRGQTEMAPADEGKAQETASQPGIAKPSGPGNPAKPEKIAAAGDFANVVVERVATANVVKGDSLWRISRKMLGQGVRYTQIYDANTAQIRDPRRIYPGQILVIPAGKAAP